ncbi:histidinol-phosphate transaminase [Tautonia sociabilis]|uniref:Histidinol-phosphate aminotransferase n=1 Tax=Tautonia sociabilis TaxID=2080755 RepID=A0A432MLU8_9BACT|nr:histidinol-phosphate transaminase [Tautonia sociabilis]RUL88068.1 histidinol-phosphate transaminase [Tautonia sociabilis]
MSTPAFLPHVERMAGYVPGEQPKDAGTIIKLNTNENPYPPSPSVGKAIAQALGDGRLRLYPDPAATNVREAVARRHGQGVTPEMVLVGNGSDDCLTIVTRAFVGPGDVLSYPTPSYILYRTLAEIQGARAVEVPFRADWTIDPAAFAADRPRLALLANPNSPSGTMLPPSAVGEIARRLDCPLVVDEAYADFAGEDCIGLVSELPNVIVTRTLSKGLSLAGLRVGYLIARPEVIAGLNKVKDSYNCDTLSLLGAEAALDDEAYTRSIRDRVIATRSRMIAAVRALGYEVPESRGNFIWCAGGPPAESVYEALKERRILVRLMRYPGRPPGLRITVGTDEQADRLLSALGEIVAGR